MRLVVRGPRSEEESKWLLHVAVLGTLKGKESEGLHTCYRLKVPRAEVGGQEKYMRPAILGSPQQRGPEKAT